MIEAGGGTPGTPTATGTLTDTDVDNTPNTFTAVSASTASDAGYGTFKMTADGVWTYTLDNTNCVVQALNDCDTLTDTFKVTTVDGTPKVVTVTINGTNDAPNDFGSSHGDSFHFKDEIFGHKGSDAINPAVVDFTGVDQSSRRRRRHPRRVGASGGSANDGLPLPGQHSADHLSIVPDHAAFSLLMPRTI